MVIIVRENSVLFDVVKGGDREKSMIIDFSEHPSIVLEIFFYFQIFKNESKILKFKKAPFTLKTL